MKNKSFSIRVKEELSELPSKFDKDRDFVRKCFLESGTISDPNRSYHMEFTLNEDNTATLAGILRDFGLNPKQTTRRGYPAVYVKEATEIADILNVMEAHKSLLYFEGVRVEKDLRNHLNRKVNFETANLNKTIHAALNQIEAIEYIAANAGLTHLPEPLEEVAKLRLQHDNASLEEIGAMLVPPISKSGVNHRLRRIQEIATNLAAQSKEAAEPGAPPYQKGEN
ncbi:MAG: DNA-binding protein WhiA [Defluviitaleaceae bacterium]|nr:DNA-binding protein WhiA [Defluviitaleaceae bacterium]